MRTQITSGFAAESVVRVEAEVRHHARAEVVDDDVGADAANACARSRWPRGSARFSTTLRLPRMSAAREAAAPVAEIERVLALDLDARRRRGRRGCASSPGRRRPTVKSRTRMPASGSAHAGDGRRQGALRRQPSRVAKHSTPSVTLSGADCMRGTGDTCEPRLLLLWRSFRRRSRARRRAWRVLATSGVSWADGRSASRASKRRSGRGRAGADLLPRRQLDAHASAARTSGDWRRTWGCRRRSPGTTDRRWRWADRLAGELERRAHVGGRARSPRARSRDRRRQSVTAPAHQSRRSIRRDVAAAAAMNARGETSSSSSQFEHMGSELCYRARGRSGVSR